MEEPLDPESPEYKRQKAKKEKEDKALIEGFELIEDAKNPQANKLIEGIQEALEKRIELLMKQDEVCQGLITALRPLGLKIITAKNIADKQTKEALGI